MAMKSMEVFCAVVEYSTVGLLWKGTTKEKFAYREFIGKRQKCMIGVSEL